VAELLTRPSGQRVSRWRTASRWVLVAFWCLFAVWAAQTGVRTALFEQALANQDAGKAIWARSDLSAGWLLRSQQLINQDPAAAAAAAQQALHLDAGDWHNWEALAESELALGNLDQAEAALDRALPLNQGFESSYELSSLELLKGSPVQFWHWMGVALARVPDDQATLIVNAALRRDPTPEASQMRAILPLQRPAVLSAAVNALLNAQRVSAAVKTWGQLRCDPPHFSVCGGASLSLSDALLNATPPETATALTVWNQAVGRGWLNQAGARPGTLTDAEFAHPWNGAGFGWVDNHSADFQVEPPAGGDHPIIHVAFDGLQPEGLQVFRQRVAVEPGARYRLTCTSRLDGDGQAGGVSLDVTSQLGQPPLTVLELPLQSDWHTSQQDFSVPAGETLVTLSLEYRRPNGQPRLRVGVDLKALALARLATGSGSSSDAAEGR